MKDPSNRARAFGAAAASLGKKTAAPSDHADWLLDEALQETFPASDPIAPARISEVDQERQTHPMSSSPAGGAGLHRSST